MAEESKLPPEIEAKITRGRERMREDAPKRNMCLAFWRNKQYVQVSSENYLVKQSTVTNIDGTGKPRHRVRTTRNLIRDFVEREVAAATQRIPSYQIAASTVDPEDISAARLAEKVALYGYDKWFIDRISQDVVQFAVITGEGFAWPYYDTTMGPVIDEQDGKPVFEGEVCIRVFGPNEVYWEPGVRFEDSRWHCVEQARPLEVVYSLPGYMGGELKTDASTNDIQGERESKAKKLVLVTEYLERPSIKHPEGRRQIIANKKPICPEESYPCMDGSGDYVDEPCLHKLAMFPDPDSDRDQGLVEDTIDAQRTYNDCASKQIEGKNLGMNPQLLAPVGSMQNRVTDEPGAVFYYKPIGGQTPTWRPNYQLPPEIFTIAEKAKEDIGVMTAQNDIPSQVSAAQAVQALLDKDVSRRGRWFKSLANFHSRLMRHCLYLVQRNYSDERLVKLRGRFGPEVLEDFKGSDLRGQADVYVLPDSIEPRTRSSIEQKIWTMFQTGLISREQAITSLQGGYGEKLLDSYELAVARANRIIQAIRLGPEAFLGRPMEMGPDGQEAPWWLPRPFDNIKLHKAIFEDWMQTEDYDYADAPIKEAANLYYQTLLQLEAQEAARMMAQEQAMAESQGMSNAANPQVKPMPSLPSVNGQQQTSAAPAK